MTKPQITKKPLGRCVSRHPKLVYGVGLSVLLAVPVQPLLAGGFQLSDHSITSLGRNHAGYGVVGDDASAVQFNPAGLTLLANRQAQFGFTLNTVSAEVVNEGSNVFGGGIAGPNEDGAPSFCLLYTSPSPRDRG